MLVWGTSQGIPPTLQPGRISLQTVDHCRHPQFSFWPTLTSYLTLKFLCLLFPEWAEGSPTKFDIELASVKTKMIFTKSKGGRSHSAALRMVTGQTKLADPLPGPFLRAQALQLRPRSLLSERASQGCLLPQGVQHQGTDKQDTGQRDFHFWPRQSDKDKANLPKTRQLGKRYLQLFSGTRHFLEYSPYNYMDEAIKKQIS